MPDGFATTAEPSAASCPPTGLDDRSTPQLQASTWTTSAAREVGRRDPGRRWSSSAFPEDLDAAIREAFEPLVADHDAALLRRPRSSATAEDLPDASFAGQQETFLNVRGIDAVLSAIKEVFASLYNDRAIAYRVHHGFEHADVALSAGVQQMVRSDVGASGVMFTMDTESGFTDAVFITSSYGLGEAVVQGAVNPDEFYVYKPALRAGRPADPQARHRRQGHEDGLHRRRDGGPDHRVRRRRRRATGGCSASPTTRWSSWPGTR